MSQDPKTLKDNFRMAGYSTEEAYFFELNRQNLIDFKQKQKEMEERKNSSKSDSESGERPPAEVVELEPRRKKAA